MLYLLSYSNGARKYTISLGVSQTGIDRAVQGGSHADQISQFS